MKVSKIIISQAAPMDQTPYAALTEKYGVQIDFKPFFLIEPLSSREFRAQRLNILDYTAIVFTARQTIDAFFRLCEELRVTVPETMKYFCSTEAVALYLQKHIVFRKRKIFFGTGTPESIVAQIGAKHKAEKFLITTNAASSNLAIRAAFTAAKLDYTVADFVKPVPQDIKDVDIKSYDLAVVYNAADIVSLKENFEGFEPGNLRFVTFGKQIVKAMEEAGYPIEIQAPTPEAPSVAKALGLYLEANK
ncbi:MAG: uroporphyrinogen-III synthase [Bacteroidales bacterium]|nr:uroporphyrinogen-III synthase [Bacteroidales bacterium]